VLLAGFPELFPGLIERLVNVVHPSLIPAIASSRNMSMVAWTLADPSALE